MSEMHRVRSCEELECDVARSNGHWLLVNNMWFESAALESSLKHPHSSLKGIENEQEVGMKP